MEARVPFLDKGFIDVAMGIDPEWKMVCKICLIAGNTKKSLFSDAMGL